MLKVYAADGLLFHEDGSVVDCPLADSIAFANKLWCAEQVVSQYNGKIIGMSKNLVIDSESADPTAIAEWRGKCDEQRRIARRRA